MKKLTLLFIPLLLLLSGCTYTTNITNTYCSGYNKQIVEVKYIQTPTEQFKGPSQFVVGCYSGDIMDNYCMVYFDSIVDNFKFIPRGYLNNPKVIDGNGKYWQFCNSEIPRDSFDFNDKYKDCK